MFERQPWMQRAGEHPGSDADYFALLARAVFSGGLGPRVVQARWQGLCFAFHGFDPEAVAVMEAGDVDRLLSDPGVIRNRRKIEAVIANARVFRELAATEGGFHGYLASLGAADDLQSASVQLAERFTHLGRTSAALFLFSAGFREAAAREAEAAVQGARGRTGSAAAGADSGPSTQAVA